MRWNVVARCGHEVSLELGGKLIEQQAFADDVVVLQCELCRSRSGQPGGGPVLAPEWVNHSVYVKGQQKMSRDREAALKNRQKKRN